MDVPSRPSPRSTVVRHRWAIVVLALASAALAGAIGGDVQSRLKSGGFEDPGSESARVAVLDEVFGAGDPDVVLVVTARAGTAAPSRLMRLAGRANWWAPRPLRRLHERFGFREVIDLEDDAVPLLPPAEPRPTVAAP